MKKNTKKNARKNNYNGRNVYGQRCIAKSVKLEKETAVEQYLAILADLEAHYGEPIEYTIDASCFNDEEAVAFYKKMTRIMALRTSVRGLPLAVCEIPFLGFVA